MMIELNKDELREVMQSEIIKTAKLISTSKNCKKGSKNINIPAVVINLLDVDNDDSLMGNIRIVNDKCLLIDIFNDENYVRKTPVLTEEELEILNKLSKKVKDDSKIINHLLMKRNQKLSIK